MAGRRCDAIDELVGRNIQVLRRNLGLSQTQLGARIGVTFQQVQKYEKGTNRVGAGRLYKMASVLRVPISAFFAGTAEIASDGAADSAFAVLSEPFVLRVAKAVSRIRSTELRRSVADLVDTLAPKGSIEQGECAQSQIIGGAPERARLREEQDVLRS